MLPRGPNAIPNPPQRPNAAAPPLTLPPAMVAAEDYNRHCEWGTGYICLDSWVVHELMPSMARLVGLALRKHNDRVSPY